MAEDILGISAHLDLGNIQHAINEIINSLDKIGVKTDVLSKRMSDAMNDIASSTDDAATKQKRAMDVLAQGIAEAKHALANYPEQLRAAKNEADATAQATARLEADLAKLITKFKGMSEGAAEYDKMKASIAGIEQQIHSNNLTQQQQLTTIQEMEAGYSTLVQMYSLGTAAVGANAVAHGTVTAATGVEAAAHTENTAAITEEKKATEEAVEAKKKLTAAQQEALNIMTPYQEELDKVSEQLKKGVDTETYIALRDRIKEIVDEIRSLISEQQKITFDFRGEKPTNEELEKFEKLVNSPEYDEASQKIVKYTDFLQVVADKLIEMNRHLRATGEAAQSASSEAVEAAQKQQQATQQENEELKRKKQQLQDLERELSEMKSKLANVLKVDDADSFTAAVKSLVMNINPKALLDGSLLDKISLERSIDEITAEMKPLQKEIEEIEAKTKQAAETVEESSKNEISQIDALIEKMGLKSMSYSQLKDKSAELEEELKKYQAEEAKMLENGSFEKKPKEYEAIRQKIADCKKEQEALNAELEGRPGYQKFFNSLREGFKGLRNNIKSTFSDIKGAFSGGEKGIGGVFSLITSGKFLGWTAAIGAVGGSIKGLSDSAERLKLALDPLRAYVDDDVLGKLRQSFIDTALAGSAQSTEDMAAAALKWIKSYEGLKDVPEAIQHVVDASRELATITGTSAEKAAESMTKLGGQFHLTAEEAAKTVNILVNASHDSTVSIQDMMSALTSSGARVNMNGASIKEYAAAIAQTTAQYGSASQAASSYQRILQRLSTETNDNFNPKVVGATKAFQNLKKEMESGTDLSKRFGKMLWSQAQYFIKNADEIANYTEKLDDATGKQNALARAEEQAAVQKAQLSNALSALAQSINLNLTPAFTRIVDGLTQFVDWCGRAIQKAGELKEKVQSWLGVGGGNKPSLHWTSQNAREQYRSLLRDSGSTLGASAQLIAAYKASDSSGLTLDELREIIRDENDKWRIAHPALTSSKTKGDSNEPGKENSVTDPNKAKEIERQAKIEEDLAKRRRKYQQEQEEQSRRAVNAEWEARIAAMKEGASKEIEQRRFDHQKRIEEIERQRQQMLEKNIEYAATEYDKNRGKGQKGFYALGMDKDVTLNTDQQREIDALLKKAYEERKKIEKEVLDQQIQSMREYLKEYGTFQQQKLAIAQEYAEKIKKAEENRDYGEVYRLQAEQRKVEGQAKANELARGIDFSQMFDGVGTIVKTIAKETYNRVQDYKATDEYRRSSAESKKAIADLEAGLIEKGGAGSVSPFSGKTWDDITAAAKRYDDALRNLQEKTDAHTAAVERDRAAQETLTKGFSSSEEQYRAMEEAVAAAAEAQRTANEQKEAQSESEQAGQEVANASNAAAKGLQDFNTILGQIKSGSLGDFANGVSNIIHQLAGKTDKEMTGLVGLIGEKAGGIVGAILSVIDMLGDNPTEVIDGILNGIERVIEEVLTHIPEIIGSILKGVARIVGSIAVGVIPRLFGLDLLGGNDNHEEQLKVQEKLNRTIASTTDALKRMTDELERSYGVLAMQTGDEAKELVRKNMESIIKGIDAALWDNYGGGGSDYYHANKALNDSRSGLYEENFFKYLKKYGIDPYEKGQGKYTWQKIFSYDPEVLAKMFKEIRDSGDDLWRVITQEMGYNDGVLEEWLQKLISTYDQLDDVAAKTLEQITTTTEDNVFDDFLDKLYAMASGADNVFEDIADNWQEMVNKMVINNLVANNFKSKLEKWYDELAKVNQQRLSNGNDDWYKKELQRLKEEYEKYARDAQKQIEDLRDMGIIAATGENAEQQSASVQAMERITVDQANELIGRMNAGQIIWQHQLDALTAQNGFITSLDEMTERIGGTVSDIARSMGEVIEMHRATNTHLANIDRNTTPIKDMADDIYRIKKLIEERY